MHGLYVECRYGYMPSNVDTGIGDGAGEWHNDTLIGLSWDSQVVTRPAGPKRCIDRVLSQILFCDFKVKLKL